MGWLWDSSDDKSDKPASSQDPLRDLDPGLRDFLKKESPVRYEPTPSSAPSESKPVKAAQEAKSSSGGVAAEDSESEVPSASLYKDGRYAHLWATYKPQSELESEAKSDAEKVNDVLEGYKYRKAEIGRAALENCALEQDDVNECYRNGGVWSKLTMCKKENVCLERCYTMQAKFLKALGYLSVLDRAPEIDEKIQMHADTLYHRMLVQEAAMEAAKVEGKPEPKFEPLLSPPQVVSPTPNAQAGMNAVKEIKVSDLPQETQAKIAQKLDGLKGRERELEEKALLAEVKAGSQVVDFLGNIYKEQDEERIKRRELGKETISDRFTSIFGGKS